jgi:SOS-response transcriptional repressor LexA
MDGQRRPGPPRRVEALAYIVERISRSNTSPSYGEIGRALRPPVNSSRAGQLVDELVALGFIARPPASRRGIVICDLVRCRSAIEEALGHSGWRHASPLGALQGLPYTFDHLPRVPPFEHIPDVD